MMHSIDTGQCILPTWCVPSPSTICGPVCDPPTPLNTLSRVVALRSTSVRSHTPVLSPGTIFNRHPTVSLTRSVLGNIKNTLFYSYFCRNIVMICLDIQITMSGHINACKTIYTLPGGREHTLLLVSLLPLKLFGLPASIAWPAG